MRTRGPCAGGAARASKRLERLVLVLVLLLAVAVLRAGTAAAGTRFAIASRDLALASPETRTSVLWLEGRRMRLEVDEATSVVYRADEDAAWVIDHRARSYRSVDRETSVTVARGVGQVNAAARRSIESLPPEQRQAAERLLDRTLGTPTSVSAGIEIRSTGAAEQVAGVACVVFEIRRAGKRVADVCRANFAAASVSDSSRNALRELAASLQVVLPVLAPEHLRQDGVDALHAFTRLDGAPMRVRVYEAQTAKWDVRVTGIEARPAPATAFELPDGYAQDLSLGGRTPARAQAGRSPPR